MLTEADAFRSDGYITVRLLGRFSTPCDELEELGHYPGTGFGSARIFLREGRKPGLENMPCIQGLGKIWSINRMIPDNYSQTVEVFINNHLVSKIRVKKVTVQGWYNLH